MTGPAARRIMSTGLGRCALLMIGWFLVGGAMASAVNATTFTSNNVPLSIPQNNNGQNQTTGVTNSTVTVAGIDTAVLKVTVSVFLTHEFTSDLTLTLRSPGGTEVILAAGIGGDNAIFGQQYGYGIGMAAAPNGQVVFDDDAAVAITAPAVVNGTTGGRYILSGTYQPQGNLGAFAGFIGTQVNGNWTLRINDDALIDTGNLRAWSITFTEPGPHIWTGAGANTNWSTAGNWFDGNVPSAVEVNAILLFPSGVTNVVANNNIPLLRVGSLTVAGDYVLTGFKVTMTNGSTIAATIGTTGNIITCSIPMDLAGATTITVPDAVTLNEIGVIGNAAAAVTAGGQVIKAALGTLTFSNTNSYTGVTSVNAGILSISNALALGTIAGGTTVANGATLQVTAAVNPGEPLSLTGTGTAGQGALSATASTNWTGAVTLAQTSSGVGAIGGGTVVTLSTFAAATGARYLDALGDGTVSLTAALPVGATTSLSVGGGTLTSTVAQTTVGGLSLNGGTINAAAGFTMGGTIAVGATAGGSTLNGTTIDLAGAGHALTIANGTAANDLTINAILSNGTVTIAGAGSVNLVSTSTANVTVTSGDLTGDGGCGNLAIGANGTFSPTGIFNAAGTVDLASSSGFILQSAGAFPRLAASGAVTLNGLAGVGGSVLQVYQGSGASGQTIITTTSTVTGTFLGLPNGSGITYNPGSPGSVVLGADSGRRVSFNPSSYTVDEGAGTLSVSVVWTGGVGTAILRNYGGSAREGVNMTLIGAPTTTVGSTVTYTVAITDNFVNTGDLTTTLAIIPTDGSLLIAPGSAPLTIIDNDKPDQKKCGFGTGLTVFLLLGFGLFFQLRLRRR